MSSVAVTESGFNTAQIRPGALASLVLRIGVIPSRQVLILGSLVAILQILDGILTGIGVSLMGISAEGNGLLRMLMEQIGTVPALLAAKLLAILVVATLCVLASEVRWVTRALQGVIVLYLVCAIIPWSTILLTRTLTSM